MSYQYPQAGPDYGQQAPQGGYQNMGSAGFQQPGYGAGYQGPPNGYQAPPSGYQQPQYAPQQQFQSPNSAPMMPATAPYANTQKPAMKEDGMLLNDKFETKPKWNDIIFALLFYAQFAAFIALSVIALRALAETGGDLSGGLGGTGSSVTIDLSTAYLFALIAAAALVWSLLFLLLVRAFTKVIIEITLFLSVVVNVAYAAYAWYTRTYSTAIIFTIFAVLSLIAYPFMRKRIPFTKALLQTVIDISKIYKSTYVIAILFTVVQSLYAVWWSFTLAASYQRWNPDAQGANATGAGASNGALIAIVIFLMFSFYWTSQVLSNVLLTTEVGIYGAWYFSGQNVPKHPAFGSFKRSMTYSFGSICFGSLIVAVLDLMRAGLNIMKQEARSDGDMIAFACTCVAECCLGCITGLVEYFNKYAYIEVALFGKSYIAAAKSAWNLLKKKGIDALVNDSLVNTVWFIGSVVVGALSCLFAFIYLRLVEPSYAPQGSTIYAVILLYAFSIGLFITNTLGTGALSAGVSTLFVGLAEEPQALQDKDPQLWNVIVQTYPHVLNPV